LPKTIIICGDRRWIDFKIIERELSKLPKDALIVEGACSGADAIAEFVAMKLGLRVKPYPAEWDKYKKLETYGIFKTHKMAGVVRNQRMLDEMKPDEVWAFHKNLDASRGTKDMVNRARKAGVPVKIFKE